MITPHPTDAQIARALARADGALAAAGHALSPQDRTISDEHIAAAMSGRISFDDIAALALAHIGSRAPRATEDDYMEQQ